MVCIEQPKVGWCTVGFERQARLFLSMIFHIYNFTREDVIRKRITTATKRVAKRPIDVIRKSQGKDKDLSA